MIFWLVLLVLSAGGVATLAYGMREGDNRTIGTGAVLLAVAVLALAWHVTHQPDKPESPEGRAMVSVQHTV